MNRTSLLLPLSVLTSALNLGCRDRTSLAEPELQPSLGTEQNVQGSGAQVVRFGAQFLFINDPDRDFSLTIGVPISEAPECGGAGELIGGTVQVVTTPAEIEHALAQFQRQTMTVYAHFTDNPCELTETDVVARGTGNGKLVVLTRGANTLFQIQATGTVELTDGGLAHVVLKGHFHIDADGSLRIHVDRFRLQPIGG